jgi:hypothetical protein
MAARWNRNAVDGLKGFCLETPLTQQRKVVIALRSVGFSKKNLTP